MNFLAHFHLAWPDQGLVAGGLEGEYYKGPIRGDLPAGIERGVLLHRAIDAYTDSHPRIVALRSQFPAGLRRYAGILIDLSFDYYLSKHWELFSDMPLRDFHAAVYRALQASQHHLSPASKRMLARMLEHDLLGMYTRWETVPAAAARIGERFKRGNPLAGIGQELMDSRELLEQGFVEFYPDLDEFSTRRGRTLNQINTAPSNIALCEKTP